MALLAGLMLAAAATPGGARTPGWLVFLYGTPLA